MTIPIVPGTSVIDTTPATEPPRRRRRWMVPVFVAGFTVLVLAGVALVWVGLDKPQISTTNIQNISHTALRKAYDTCGRVGDIYDSDKTLVLDMRGRQDVVGLNMSDTVCVLNDLNTPRYVMAHMEQTRALDGRQSDTWGDFEASWTYHPDHGLDVLIREK